MNREQFIDKLRIALSGAVNHNIIDENVRYYEDYIHMEMQKGRTEDAVLAELGDPRLLAKTIIETNKIAGTSTADYGDEPYEEGGGRGDEPKLFRMPGWLLGLIVLLVIGILFAMVTSVISFLLPVLIPMLIIIVIARTVQRFWR